METMKLIETENGRCLMPRVRVARSVPVRFIGLMGRSGLEPGSGLYFPRCSSIHMFFMRFPIDAVYFNGEKEVVKIVPHLKPWRLSWCPAAQSVLEAPAGWAAKRDVKMGMQVVLCEPGEM